MEHFSGFTPTPVNSPIQRSLTSSASESKSQFKHRQRPVTIVLKSLANVANYANFSLHRSPIALTLADIIEIAHWQ